MKAKTGQIFATPVMTIVMTIVSGVSSIMLAQAQTTGGQARAAQGQAAQARGGAAATPASPRPATQAAPAPTRPAGATAAAAAPIRPPRRDPFRPLVSNKKVGDVLPARLPAGKAGLVIGQLVVQGIVRNIDGKWVAVVDNKTKRSYFLYVRDELYNGAVTNITPDSVTFEERSVDAAGRTRSREVVKRIGGV
ncbi:MAG: hypothetical protein EXQ56_12635 [Acidobacteria bacterium]|nr:hypothetical protein [Acidobacteriota bacterium]